MLLSYAKIALQHDLLESGVPDEPGLEPWLTGYFPSALRERFAGDIDKHSLRREIIALGLTNAVVNRGGPAMAVRLAEETQRTTADVAYAYLATREVFELPALWLRIDALDGKAKGAAQLALYQATQDLVNAQTLWFLRNGSAMSDLPGTIARHRAGVAALKAGARERAAGSPAGAARGGGSAGSPARASRPTSAPTSPRSISWGWRRPSPRSPRRPRRRWRTRRAPTSPSAIGLRISDLAAKAGAIATPDYYDRLAVAQALSQLAGAQAAFTRDAIRSRDAGGPEAWLARQGDRLGRIRAMLEEIAGEGTLTVSRLLVAAGQLGDLAAATSAAPSASARTGRAGGRSKSAASGSQPARRPARQPRS